MRYLTYDTLLKIHEDQVQSFGGDPGIRDRELLKSIHRQPFQTFGDKEVYPSLFEKSAALGHGIVANHPFVDGNKRTGAVSMILLLEINGYRFEATNSELVEKILDVARGNVTKEELSNWLKIHSEEK